jgi:hypothetical protein
VLLTCSRLSRISATLVPVLVRHNVDELERALGAVDVRDNDFNGVRVDS